MQSQKSFNQSKNNSRQFEQNSKHSGPNLTAQLPPLENVSLSMKVDTDMMREKPNETENQANDISILDMLEVKERTPKFKKMEVKLRGQIQQVGVLLSAFSPADGIIVVEHSSARADEIISYAEVNSDFCKALEQVLNASPLVAMIAGLGTTVSAILSNHGMNPIENLAKKRLENAKNNVSGVSQAL